MVLTQFWAFVARNTANLQYMSIAKLFSVTWRTIKLRTATSSLHKRNCYDTIYTMYKTFLIDKFIQKIYIMRYCKFLQFGWRNLLELVGFQEYTSAPTSHLKQSCYFVEIAPVEQLEHGWFRAIFLNDVIQANQFEKKPSARSHLRTHALVHVVDSSYESCWHSA